MEVVPRGVLPIPSDHDLEVQSPKYHTPPSSSPGPIAVKSISTLSASTGQSIVKAGTQPGKDGQNGQTHILQVTQKPSCVLTNVVSTCVNKASSHLELLQTLIEEWFAQDEQCQDHARAAGTRRKQSLYGLPPSAAKGSPASSTAGRLSVAGTGYKNSITDELPYLGALEVLQEAYALLRRLELDREETEANLRLEKQRARMLQRKTDNLATHRAVDFPAAVQAEHDASVEDLNELHWHVTYKQRTQSKLQERVDNANLFNQRLSEDIQFVGKHCPLVEEKLALETDAMEKINDAQQQTDHELEATLDRLARTKVRNEEAHMKSNQEREAMATDLENIRRELKEARTELSDARRLHHDHLQGSEDALKLISDGKQGKQVLLSKLENSKHAEKMHERKIDELHNKVRLVESEHHKLDEEFFNKEKQYETTVSTMESQFSELKKANDHEDNVLKTMTKQNDMLAIEVDEISRSMAKWEQKIVEDEKNLRRMNNQITNTEIMMNQMLDEYSKIQVINSAIKDKLQEERERTSMIEDSLRQTLETLKKQCKDEIHTRTVLTSRISSDGNELVKSHTEAKQKKEKLTKTVAQLEETLKVVNDKVDKLRTIHGSKKMILDGLQDEVRTTIESRQQCEDEFTSSKKELDPYLKELKEKDSKLRGQIGELNSQLELMGRKRSEMNNSIKVLEKSIKQNESAVVKLQAELNELNQQLEDQTNLFNNVTSAREDLTRRITDRHKEHAELVKDRNETIAHYKKILATELSINSGLAQAYRKLQGEYVEVKSNAMDMVDERNRLEAGIRDLKQIKGLQARLHKALETYYKFRGLFNAGELERVISENKVSASKVTQLQDGYSSVVNGITGFLQTQMRILNDRTVVEYYGSNLSLEDIDEEPEHAVNAATNT